MSNQSLWLSTHPLTRSILFNISRLSLLDFGTALSKVFNFPFLLIWRYFHDTPSIINHTAFIARLDELKIRLPETPRLSIGHVVILFGDDWTNFESLSGSLWDTQRVDHRGVGCKNNRKKSIRYKSYWGHPNSQSNFFWCVCALVHMCAYHRMSVKVRGKFSGVCSLFPPQGLQELNSVCQAWLHMPLSSEPPSGLGNAFKKLLLLLILLWDH